MVAELSRTAEEPASDENGQSGKEKDSGTVGVCVCRALHL